MTVLLALLCLLLCLLLGGAPMALAAECPDSMVPIPAGRFQIGAAGQLPEEGPARAVRLSAFCLQSHEVSNREFAAFVEASGYRTVAERPLSEEQFPDLPAAERRAGSVVFRPPAAAGEVEELSWWQWVPGADWRHPEGPGSSIDGRLDHPVVHVAVADAVAYADWVGAALPSEAQWEFAARGGLRDQVFGWGETWSPRQANTWQGDFPRLDSAEDGYAGTAPVASFPANDYGLHDMTGNVWEWTSDWYQIGHGGLSGRRDPTAADRSVSSDPRDPGVAKHVIKGGSFLCSSTYCSRYRPAAREAECPDTGTSHIGFRLVAPLSSALSTALPTS
ncbi:formylglycine-generating enzyme family protein [Synechococcus sp. J7-Johnson]|uniref:formylglycine-generating enzyme family protein n=1 Tax=Synechococcus sp. J7-Johnson TaxID=2823737 RepID=UPI0020CD9389|nr:formylglycine-generating enzyme family protein [Synechococcus sp. J7-Johnson]MCP9842101.1 formylglycine-generating enzyme family protein [Synechococcus sp. J7-Johnson]